MNLHAIVAGAIGAVNAHEQITLWRCTGITTNKGIVTPQYQTETRRAQIQAPSASDLQLNERVAKAPHAIKAWMDAPASTINRLSQTAGDIIQRADGSFWLIVGTVHDYSPEGWLCCLAILQTKPPAGFKEGDSDEPSE
jgi:hypothetical protein